MNKKNNLAVLYCSQSICVLVINLKKLNPWKLKIKHQLRTMRQCVIWRTVGKSDVVEKKL